MNDRLISLEPIANKPGRPVYEFGPFRLDVAKRLVLRDSQPVALTQRVFETLLVLVENGGRVVSKDELMEKLWPDTVVEEANLTVNISSLRKALGETAGQHRYIATVPGRGYQFVAAVERVDEERIGLMIEKHTSAEIIIEEREDNEPSDSINPEREIQALPSTTSAIAPVAAPVSTGALASRHNRSRLHVITICALAVAVACLGVLAWQLSKGNKTAPGRAPGSIAVLPFKLLDSNNSDEYRGVGMADALITRLGGLKQVNVRPTSAVLKYNHLEQDPVAAGRELSVEAVLEGSIRESGDMVRVTVQLVSVETGAPIWTDKFDESVANVFAVEDRVSTKVADALTLTLTGEEKERLAKRYTGSFEAYQEYLKGRFYANRRTPETVKTALQHFNRAIEMDPDFALAHVAIADSYVLLGLRAYSVLSPHDAMPKARSAALKALEIDDGFAEAHSSLAQVKMRYEWDWPGAEREFKRAIDLNPGYAVAHQVYAELLFITGRSDQALVEIKLAQKIDPSALGTSATLGLHLCCLGQYDEAIAQSIKALDRDPNLYTTRLVLSLAYEQKGMYEEAMIEAQKALAFMPGKSGEALVGHIYAKTGRRDDALKVIEQFERSSRQNYVDPIYIAGIYSGLQDSDRTLEWLEKGFNERSPALIYVKYDPRYGWLRSNPKFQDLLRRIGFHSE
jgi:DNA-binding winged helix-turn-helix (wHTH) protein/TolB-like protein/tetratricopeptide (TPR) repeat protein